MYDLRFRTDVRFREVWCKEGNFYWHSSGRQLVRVMLTPFFVLFGHVLWEDGKGKGQRKIWQHPLPDGKSCLPADHGVVVIPSPPVCKALEELGRDFLLSPVLSGWLFPLRPTYVLSFTIPTC